MSRNQWLIAGGLGLAAVVVYLCLGFVVLIMVTSASRQTSPEVSQSEATEVPQPTVRIAGTSTRASLASPTATKSPTNVATLSPEGTLANLALASGKDDNLILDIPPTIENGEATVQYKFSTELFNDDQVILAMTSTFTKLAPATFKTFPKVNTLLTGVMIPVQDMYGNSKMETGMVLKVTRATAGKINWDTYNSLKLDKILTGEGDLFSVHQLLLPAWNRLAK